MLIQGIFNKTKSRPYRWALKQVYEGDIIEKYWVDTEQYVYPFEKVESTVGVKHNVQTWYPEETSPANFRPMRKHHVGFLTTFHRNFGEDTKYVEVLNDPVNYIGAYGETSEESLPIDYGEAYLQAEQRIGNYRIGARRNITHLGGTFSDDMLDALSSVIAEDFYPTAFLSFPFFPPRPTNYAQAERINLLTTDSGYVNYLKANHPSINNNLAYVTEQGSSFRRFIWAANTQTTHATVLNDNDAVNVQDMETVLDNAVTTALHANSGVEEFVPTGAGEDIIINIPGQHVISSTDAGWYIEMFSDATLETSVSSIAIEKATGDVEITAGSQIIKMDRDASITIANGVNRTITMTTGTSGTVNVT